MMGQAGRPSSQYLAQYPALLCLVLLVSLVEFNVEEIVHKLLSLSI